MALLTLIVNTPQSKHESLTEKLDSYFSSLIDIIPLECYFDAETLSELRSNTALPLKTFGSSLPKVNDYSKTVSQSVYFLEKSEEAKKSHSAVSEQAKSRLQKRIQQLQSKRKGKQSRKKDEASSVATEKRSPKVRAKNKHVAKGSNVKTNISKDEPQTGNFAPLFSRFSFMNSDGKSAGDGKRKLSNVKLLAKAEKREAKVSALRQEDVTVARQVETKDAWQKALDKARGTKVKDDPKVLRKLIRKQRSLKRRSVRRWADRDQSEASKATERQEKRQRNLDKAKAVRAKTRMRKAVQKGHVLPGF